MSKKDAIAQDRDQGRFGNRRHGRFPRLGVEVQDGTRPNPRNFLFVFTRDRHAYENGPTTYLCLSRRDLRMLVNAGAEALAYRAGKRRHKP